MNERISVEVLRPLLLRGDVLTAGRSSLAIADAAAAVDTGRAALVDPADAPKLEAYRRDEMKRAMKALGRIAAPEGEPWQRVD